MHNCCGVGRDRAKVLMSMCGMSWIGAPLRKLPTQEAKLGGNRKSSNHRSSSGKSPAIRADGAEGLAGPLSETLAGMGGG